MSGSGLPPKTTVHQDRKMLKIVNTESRKTAVDVKNNSGSSAKKRLISKINKK